jgi:hypothetical protein
MTVRTKRVLVAVPLVLVGIGGLCFLGALALGRCSSSAQNAVPSFVAKDPHSPTIVRLEGTKTLLGSIDWDCIISVDRQQATQYAGWPKDRVAAGASPKAVKWHSDPDWLEIILTSGELLKLTWDQNAVKKARESNAAQYFLDPEFEVLKNP